jgi:hypothetical protein
LGSYRYKDTAICSVSDYLQFERIVFSTVFISKQFGRIVFSAVFISKQPRELFSWLFQNPDSSGELFSRRFLFQNSRETYSLGGLRTRTVRENYSPDGFYFKTAEKLILSAISRPEQFGRIILPTVFFSKQLGELFSRLFQNPNNPEELFFKQFTSRNTGYYLYACSKSKNK